MKRTGYRNNTARDWMSHFAIELPEGWLLADGSMMSHETFDKDPNAAHCQAIQLYWANKK